MAGLKFSLRFLILHPGLFLLKDSTSQYHIKNVGEEKLSYSHCPYLKKKKYRFYIWAWSIFTSLICAPGFSMSLPLLLMISPLLVLSPPIFTQRWPKLGSTPQEDLYSTARACPWARAYCWWESWFNKFNSLKEFMIQDITTVSHYYLCLKIGQ